MMNINGFFGSIYNIGMWLSKIMYLHLLWVLFTVAGLGVFGIAPATAVLVSMIYKGFENKADIPIFKNFFSEYKTQFIKMNGIGLLLMGVGIFLYVDIRISQQMIQSYYLHYLLIFIGFIFLMIALYIFTIFARYELSFFNYFKQSFLIAIARPFESIAMIVSLVLLIYLFSYLPVLLVFMGSSLTAYPLVWFGYRACLSVEDKQMSLKEEEEKTD